MQFPLVQKFLNDAIFIPSASISYFFLIFIHFSCFIFKVRYANIILKRRVSHEHLLYFMPVNRNYYLSDYVQIDFSRTNFQIFLYFPICLHSVLLPRHRSISGQLGTPLLLLGAFTILLFFNKAYRLYNLLFFRFYGLGVF